MTSISVNGQSKVPPGFRFHPTEEELLQYYLMKKVSNEPIDLEVIKDIDLNTFEPWDIQEICKIGSSTLQSDWYIFSHKDKKYPTSTRTNRATAAGFWKATGRDKLIHSNNKRIGMRKTLVFYKGRAPNGHKSDWIMHEYRLLDDNNNIHTHDIPSATRETVLQEEGWVVCRIFKKKNHYKTFDRPNISGGSSSSIITREEATVTERVMMDSSYNDEGTLEQILQHIGRPCKEENDESKKEDEVAQFFNTNINVCFDDDKHMMKQLDYFIDDPMMVNFDDVLDPILPSSSSSSAINTEDCNSQVDFWSFPESIFLSPNDPLCLTSI